MSEINFYTHFCRVETDEDSPQGPELGPEASLTSSTEPLADSPQRISLSDYEDGAPAGELSLAGHTHFQGDQLPVLCSCYSSYYIISLRMLLALNLLLQVDEKARKSTSVEFSGDRLRTQS